jgi:tRNA U34 5-methylaminomethyl-2-thiouridine-forming methyltransferase MnmC
MGLRVFAVKVNLRTVVVSVDYIFEETQDGSQTLRRQRVSETSSEAMHSTKGAFSETVFIYGTAAAYARDQKWPAHFLSIGLGLGYVEMVLFAAFLQFRDATFETLTVDSFESDPFLRVNFAMWLQCPDRLRHEQPQFFATYEDNLRRSAAHFGVAKTGLVEEMRLAYRQNRLRLQGSFGAGLSHGHFYSGVFFDAFSANSSPELWTPSLLEHILGELCSAQAVFATYAATGHLKRALLRFQFAMLRTAGFGGKRESTLAVRHYSGVDQESAPSLLRRREN